MVYAKMILDKKITSPSFHASSVAYDYEVDMRLL